MRANRKCPYGVDNNYEWTFMFIFVYMEFNIWKN